jgi:hypothetical protein
VPGIDNRVLWQTLASVGAKLLLLAFISPFVVLATASAFAIAASQLGDVAGWIAAPIVLVAIALLLNHWLWIVGREFR